MTIEHNGITYELLELVEPNKREKADIIGIFKEIHIDDVPQYEMVTYYWGVPRDDDDIKKLALEQLAKIDYYVVRVETILDDDIADKTQEFPTLKDASDFVARLMADKQFLLETIGEPLEHGDKVFFDIAHSTEDDFIVLEDLRKSIEF